MIKIFTDGSSDLPEAVAAQYNISVVPLYVHFGNDTYTSEMDTGEFYRRMKAEKELPKTSSPSPMDFVKRFKESLKEYGSIMVITLSTPLSSTYHHALMAKEIMREEGYDQPIEVVDAKTTSVGLGILTVRAAQLTRAGVHLSDLMSRIKRQVQETHTYFTLDTLENVIKGGRLDRLKGTVASVLNIKLVMQASEEGAVEVMEKIRGMPKALKRLVDKVGESWHSSDKKILGIAHSNCEARAKELIREIMQKYPFEEIVLTNMGPVIGTYAGEGGIVIAY